MAEQGITVTLKSSNAYDSPWIVLNGDDMAALTGTLQAIAQVNGDGLSFGQLVTQAARQFHNDYAVGDRLGAKPVDEPVPSPQAQQQAMDNLVYSAPDLDGLAELQRRLDAAQSTADISKVFRDYKKQASESEDVRAMFGEAQARIKKAANS